jgi:cysteine desulfurase
MTGGGHERGIRSGNLNVAGIVGFGVAASLIDPIGESVQFRALSDILVRELEGAGSFDVYSNHQSGLPNTLSIRFPGADAEAVMANAPDIAVSTGSACTAALPQPSHVLTAMGIPSEAAFETLRVSIGRPTTEEDVVTAAEAIRRSVEMVRGFTLEAQSIHESKS